MFLLVVLLIYVEWLIMCQFGVVCDDLVELRWCMQVIVVGYEEICV